MTTFPFSLNTYSVTPSSSSFTMFSFLFTFFLSFSVSFFFPLTSFLSNQTGFCLKFLVSPSGDTVWGWWFQLVLLSQQLGKVPFLPLLPLCSLSLFVLSLCYLEWVLGKFSGSFDPDLRSVLELATDSELYELEDILFGPRLLLTFLNSSSARLFLYLVFLCFFFFWDTDCLNTLNGL